MLFLRSKYAKTAFFLKKNQKFSVFHVAKTMFMCYISVIYNK